jgi:hypothetical protein
MISLSPDEVERRFVLLGIPNRFSQAEKTELATTSIVSNDRDVIAFPIPKANEGLNILELRNLRGVDPMRPPSFFDHPWYLTEEFARKNCAPGWHFIYRDVLTETISKPLYYVSSLRTQGLGLPAAAEITLMLFLHYAGTGEQLLQKKHTWCSDHASMDRFVTVGAFGRNGLFISGHPPVFASRGLGICAKIMH